MLTRNTTHNKSQNSHSKFIWNNFKLPKPCKQDMWRCNKIFKISQILNFPFYLTQKQASTSRSLVEYKEVEGLANTRKVFYNEGPYVFLLALHCNTNFFIVIYFKI